MHEKVLPRGSKQVLASLEQNGSPALDGWTLAGGTGLALQLGHRVSIDFDFFRTDKIDVPALQSVLRSAGPCETLQEAEHTLTVLVRRVKLSFFQVSDPLLFKPGRYRFFSLADPRDIALMKLAAIAGRGSRKDFIDLYSILLGDMTLRDYFELLPRKFGKGRANEYHILKSLTYFNDAEKEPMPRMLVPFSWKNCKAFFLRESQRLILPP